MNITVQKDEHLNERIPLTSEGLEKLFGKPFGSYHNDELSQQVDYPLTIEQVQNAVKECFKRLEQGRLLKTAEQPGIKEQPKASKEPEKERPSPKEHFHSKLKEYLDYIVSIARQDEAGPHPHKALDEAALRMVNEENLSESEAMSLAVQLAADDGFIGPGGTEHNRPGGIVEISEDDKSPDAPEGSKPFIHALDQARAIVAGCCAEEGLDVIGDPLPPKTPEQEKDQELNYL